MAKHDVVIRPFQASDTKALSHIWFQASLIAHPFIGERRLLEQRSLIEDQYLPSTETWVAAVRDQPVGFISLLDTFIGGLFVSPDRQGLGIGSQLIAHALGLKGELSLEVYTNNQKALRFYSRLGFRELSRRTVDDEGFPYENARLRLAG